MAIPITNANQQDFLRREKLRNLITKFKTREENWIEMKTVIEQDHEAKHRTFRTNCKICQHGVPDEMVDHELKLFYEAYKP